MTLLENAAAAMTRMTLSETENFMLSDCDEWQRSSRAVVDRVIARSNTSNLFTSPAEIVHLLQASQRTLRSPWSVYLWFDVTGFDIAVVGGVVVQSHSS